MVCVISWPILIILIVCIAACSSQKEKEDRSWVLDLPKMKGRRLEVVLKETSTSPYRLPNEGKLIDLDDEWILMSCETFNGEIRKLIRIVEIESVKVID